MIAVFVLSARQAFAVYEGVCLSVPETLIATCCCTVAKKGKCGKEFEWT